MRFHVPKIKINKPRPVANGATRTGHLPRIDNFAILAGVMCHAVGCGIRKPQRISVGLFARLENSDSRRFAGEGARATLLVHSLMGEDRLQSGQYVSENLFPQLGQVACLAKVSKAWPQW